jgi:GxxExxY protein
MVSRWDVTNGTGTARIFNRGYTQMHADVTGVNRLSECVIGCAFKVINTLGSGFLEKNYENALAHELRKSGLTVAQQHGVTVEYDDITIGTYAVDLLVEETIIVELKAVRALDQNHMAQCINYPKATGLHLCLLLNFGGSRLEIRRIAHDLSASTEHLRASACIRG